VKRSAWLGLVLLLGSGIALAGWVSDTQSAMGTRIHAEAWSEDEAAARVVLSAVMAEMQRMDRTYSPYREDSELSRVNAQAASGWVEISSEFLDILQKSQYASQISGGAFDITYASAGRYYDYRNGDRPDAERLTAAARDINYRYVEIDPELPAVRFARNGVYVDLGGIAKGYAVDRGIAIMQRAGIEHGALTAGGDSRIIGDRLGKPWTVGVRDPRDETEMVAVLPLTDTAVSTSGDYERFFEEDGVRYHHILDPTTGDSARDSWSVTVLGPEAAFTDALSTSVFVLGVEKGLQLIDRLPGIDAIVIDANGKLHYSSDLAELAPN
jgi:thiamine biosynthesis lipoprotein